MSCHGNILYVSTDHEKHPLLQVVVETTDFGISIPRRKKPISIERTNMKKQSSKNESSSQYSRLQILMPQERMRDYTRLQTRAGVMTKKDLLVKAIDLYEWAVDESSRGNMIGSITPGGDLARLTTPELTRVYKEALTNQEEFEKESG